MSEAGSQPGRRRGRRSGLAKRADRGGPGLSRAPELAARPEFQARFERDAPVGKDHIDARSGKASAQRTCARRDRTWPDPDALRERRQLRVLRRVEREPERDDDVLVAEYIELARQLEGGELRAAPLTPRHDMKDAHQAHAATRGGAVRTSRFDGMHDGRA